MKRKKENLKKEIFIKDGKLWFTKNAEKKIFFFMTIIMLLLGIGYFVAGL
jgi:hypothetical protein